MALRLDDFKIARRWNGANRFLQIAFSILLVLGLNYLASQPKYQARWNLSSAQRESLSRETRKYLEAVGKRAPATTTKDNPWVQVFVLLSADPGRADREMIEPFLRQINYLLEDVSYSAAQGAHGRWLSVESADSIKNRGTWSDLARRFGEPDDSDALAVVCEGRFKYIKMTDMMGIRTTASGIPEVNSFRGELALMSAILSVTGERAPVIYFTTGHGEMSPEDVSMWRGLYKLSQELSKRNLDVKLLDLGKFNEVPTNTELIIIASPTTAFRTPDVEKLRRYMREKKGRLIALVDAGAQHGLDDLFYEWGIRVADAKVIETSKDLLTIDGDIMLRAVKSPHDLVKLMQGNGAVLVTGQARPVGFDLASPIDDNLRVDEIIASSAAPGSWADVDYQRPPLKFDFDRGDIPGPVVVAAVAERAAGLKQGIKIPGGRMLVVGSGDIATNARINENTNRFFVTNAVMWMLDRESFLNIPSRPLAEFKLSATRSDLNSVAWRFLLVPGGALLLGLFVFFWRRNT